MATIDPQALRTFRNSLTGHALTTSEKADALQILSECADEIERLRRVEAAARDYYMGYVQDEADDDGREVTGCCETQHLYAQALRDALSPNPSATGATRGGRHENNRHPLSRM